MLIENLLTQPLTFAKVEGVSKKRVIDTISQKFAAHYMDINASELFMNLVGREKLGSTGIGDGIAIPHCRFPTGGATLCICMTLETPVDFDAIDQKPVDIVFAMVVPEDSESEHLETLSSLAARLQEKSYVEALRAAGNEQALYTAAIK